MGRKNNLGFTTQTSTAALAPEEIQNEKQPVFSVTSAETQVLSSVRNKNIMT